MAQYKVPQDVEAEDKLLGPFTFRQFIYLMIGAACCAGVWGALQIFAPLAVIPLPFGIFFIVLALPLKKDQPMETYLAAVISFRLKPNKRVWTAGQRESTILITAPKKKEKSRTRDITEDEASHRLSFLADIVDTEGAAIRGNRTSIREEYVAEANQIDDILEANNSAIDRMIAQEQAERHAELVSQMRSAVHLTSELTAGVPAAPQTPSAAQVSPQTAQTLQALQAARAAQAQNQQTQAQQTQQSQPPRPVPLSSPTYSVPTQELTPQAAPTSNYTPVREFTDPTYAPRPYMNTMDQVRQAQAVAEANVAPQPQPRPQYIHVNPFATNQQPAPIQPAVSEQLAALANNRDYSIQTIAAEANRIQSQSIFTPKQEK